MHLHLHVCVRKVQCEAAVPHWRGCLYESYGLLIYARKVQKV